MLRVVHLPVHEDDLHPLFRAVYRNNLQELKTLIESGISVNTSLSNGGHSLLTFAIERGGREIFDYLLSLDETDVNYLDDCQRSPLLLVARNFNEYYAQELIKKGADVNAIWSGHTFLHLAPKYCQRLLVSENDVSLAVGEIVIEKGADLNRRGICGNTPLYSACEKGNYAWICMLLCYGADSTITNIRGILPLVAVSSKLPEHEQLLIQETLFNYTFDEDSVTVRLATIVKGMITISNFEFFCKILDNISDIDYDEDDLDYVFSSLSSFKLDYLKLFIERFGYVLKEIFEKFPLIEVLSQVPVTRAKAMIDIFLGSEFLVDFIHCLNKSVPTISILLDSFNKRSHTIEDGEITNIIYIMLSYGLEVTTTDLNTVYRYYGCSELFRILLHMDVRQVDHSGPSLAELFYNPSSTIDDFLGDPSLVSALLNYYNDPRLKKNSLMVNQETDRVRNLPQVPYLIELARNAARKYIVDNFNARRSARFYTILRWLPIGEMNRKIIAMEKKLY